MEEVTASNLENKKVTNIEYATGDNPEISAGDDRMYYRFTFEDGTCGEWERSDVYANEPEKFAALKDRLKMQNGL